MNIQILSLKVFCILRLGVHAAATTLLKSPIFTYPHLNTDIFYWPILFPSVHWFTLCHCCTSQQSVEMWYDVQQILILGVISQLQEF